MQTKAERLLHYFSFLWAARFVVNMHFSYVPAPITTVECRVGAVKTLVVYGAADDDSCDRHIWYL